MKKSLHYGILILLATYLSLSGCGYRFNVEGRGPTLGGGASFTNDGPPLFLAIPTLENRTFESNLEYKYTEYLKDEFVVAGGAKVVDDIQGADYVMKGAIQSVNLPSLTFTQNQTQESRVTVNVKVEVKDRRSGEIVWSQSSTGSAEFFVGSSADTGGSGGGLQFNRVLQDRALEQAGQFIAEDLADRFLFAREQGMLTPKPKESSVDPLASPSNDSSPLPSESQPSLAPHEK